MSGPKIMRNDQPNRYWVFRNLVSSVQLSVVLVLLVALTLWLASDNNGIELWDGYLKFSKDISAWGKNMNLPWE